MLFSERGEGELKERGGEENSTKLAREGVSRV